ncbi:hypothetical protein GCM10009745_60770 [Kribbella yunnanensis]|uniref:Uncharacterized protein n=1 Tax=Kribbella yunnanensis TaxID=190194 RepID=A0ABP4ULR9_9ACTN
MGGFGCISVVMHRTDPAALHMGASAFRVRHPSGPTRWVGPFGCAAGFRSSGSRQLLLSGGVAPVVCGGVRFGPAEFRGQCRHHSVDRHASETHGGPGYDEKTPKFLDVT